MLPPPPCPVQMTIDAVKRKLCFHCGTPPSAQVRPAHAQQDQQGGARRLPMVDMVRRHSLACLPAYRPARAHPG